MNNRPQSPRSNPQKRIIDAARSLFFVHGVSAVTMEMIVAEARTSKMTLYKYFPDKMLILKACLEEECDRLYDPQIPLPDTKAAFAKTMVEFGVNLMKLLSDPEIIRFDQLMLSQGPKHPDLAETYTHACERTTNQLEKLIAHGKKHGFITRKQSPAFLADMLMNSWKGKPYQMALYGLQNIVYPDVKKHAIEVIHVVLDIDKKILGIRI